MAVLECFEPSKKVTTYLHMHVGLLLALSPNGLCHGRQCWLLLLHKADIHLMSLGFKALNATCLGAAFLRPSLDTLGPPGVQLRVSTPGHWWATWTAEDSDAGGGGP